MKRALILFGAVISAFLVGGAAVASEVTPAGLESSVPIGLTADLSAVPDLPVVAIAPPYQLAWQQRLLAMQLELQEAIARDTATPIDPIETGSISAAR